MKIDHYNSELYRFKVGAFFEKQCTINTVSDCISLLLNNYPETVSKNVKLLWGIICSGVPISPNSESDAPRPRCGFHLQHYCDTVWHSLLAEYARN